MWLRNGRIIIEKLGETIKLIIDKYHTKKSQLITHYTTLLLHNTYNKALVLICNHVSLSLTTLQLIMERVYINLIVCCMQV